jgi:hypothetical protein
MTRIDTTGHVPFIEFRPSVNQYFVVFEDLGIELAPSFILPDTAREVALHAAAGTPFYQMIPSVPYRTAWPRPNVKMPRLNTDRIEHRVRDYGD